MYKMKIYFHAIYSFIVLLIGCLLIGGTIKAQSSYTFVGSARQNSPDCYILTDDSPNQYGAIWNNKRLRLTESFEIEYKINFGNIVYGADGVVMVLQPISNNVLGSPGSGIGFTGLSPALGIEFDTYQNPNLGDPPANHIALIREIGRAHV